MQLIRLKLSLGFGFTRVGLEAITKTWLHKDFIGIKSNTSLGLGCSVCVDELLTW